MDIMALIDKYIEISVRKEILEKTIIDANQNEAYAKVEGDMAFYNGDFIAEHSYNNSAKYHRETKQKAESELAQVMQLLEFIHQSYEQAVLLMDQIQLKETAIKVSTKADELQIKLDELSETREWAKSKGDIAFANHNFQKEHEYNRISADCYLEINRIKQVLHYYNSFVYDLNFRAYNKTRTKF